MKYPFRFAFATLWLFVCGAVFAEPGESKVNSKQQCEQLIDSVLPFASQMLTGHGEFFPFGGTMDINGKIGMSGGWTGEEHPPSSEVISLLHSAFVAGAREGKLMATALVYDVRVVPPGQETKTDAIAVDVSHRDGVSQTVIYPYQLRDKKLIVGKPYAMPNQHPVFAQ